MFGLCLGLFKNHIPTSFCEAFIFKTLKHFFQNEINVLYQQRNWDIKYVWLIPVNVKALKLANT